MRLIVPEPHWRRISDQLAGAGALESAGIALATPVETAGRVRLLIRHVRLPEEAQYLERGPARVVLTPEFVAKATREAREQKLALVFFHSHPFTERARFSVVDDDGEAVLKAFVDRRAPDLPHAAWVIGTRLSQARLLGSRTSIEVMRAGPSVAVVSEPERASGPFTEGLSQYDRQIRVLGEASQTLLQSVKVGIVGLGGTGSIVAQQLAHLGVSDFKFIDPDVIEASNLNRVAGATLADVGIPKVDVAASLVKRIQPKATVRKVQDSVLRNAILPELLDCDVLFCCTDSHGSRYVLNEIAHRFVIPCFDCGVVIAVADGRVTHVSGRAQMLSPGLACLTCSSLLDAESVRRDLLSDFERASDPYIVGAQGVQPAVVSINAVVSSLTVTMFLGAFAGFPAQARHQRYNAIEGVVRNISTAPSASCVSCSEKGASAVGGQWPLPGRPT